MSEFIRKGDPTKKTELVSEIAKALSKNGYLGKRSIHGADVAFCSRKAVLHLALPDGMKYPMDASSALYFAIGNSVHDAIAQAVQKAGILIANEFPVKFNIVKGYIDNIIISPETGQLKIIDIKTCGRLPSKVKVGQAEQVMAYAVMSGIREASVLYVSRSVADFNGLLIKEISVPITGDTIARSARIMAESMVYARGMAVVPKPNYRVTPQGCGWCPFRQNGCFGTEDGILKLRPGYYYKSESSPDLEGEVIALQKVLISEMNSRYQKTLEALATFPKTERKTFNEWKVSAGEV